MLKSVLWSDVVFKKTNKRKKNKNKKENMKKAQYVKKPQHIRLVDKMQQISDSFLFLNFMY